MTCLCHSWDDPSAVIARLVPPEPRADLTSPYNLEVEANSDLFIGVIRSKDADYRARPGFRDTPHAVAFDVGPELDDASGIGLTPQLVWLAVIYSLMDDVFASHEDDAQARAKRILVERVHAGGYAREGPVASSAL